MPTIVGSIWMVSVVSAAGHNRPGALVTAVLLLFVYCTFIPEPANAGLPERHAYFLQEPVFGGQARIVEAGRKNASLVVLVHGLNESAETWYPFIPALAQHLHVLSFDLPGFGQSSQANKLYTPDNYVAFIRFVLNRYPIQKIILVGHSLGANIALRYAAKYPQQVERLLLVDAAGILHRLTFSRFLSHFGIQALPSLYPGQQQDLQSLADGVLGTLTRYSTLADLGESAILSDSTLRQDLLGGYPPAIATHAMMMTEFRNILDNFQVPTLLVWGGRDQVTPLRTGKMLAANFRNAGLVIIKQAGHNPLHDTPEQFSRWLLRFASADMTERNAILRQNRYALSVDTGVTAGRNGYCSHEKNKVFRGRYKFVVIDHCQGVLFEDFIADSVSVSNSQAVFENCSLHNGHGKGLRLKNSDVAITACRIQGSPAIELSNTRLDMAGSHVFSAAEAIRVDVGSVESDILFSISQINSGEQNRLMHGPLSLSPGQSL